MGLCFTSDKWTLERGGHRGVPPRYYGADYDPEFKIIPKDSPRRCTRCHGVRHYSTVGNHLEAPPGAPGMCGPCREETGP